MRFFPARNRVKLLLLVPHDGVQCGNCCQSADGLRLMRGATGCHRRFCRRCRYRPPFCYPCRPCSSWALPAPDGDGSTTGLVVAAPRQLAASSGAKPAGGARGDKSPPMRRGHGRRDHRRHPALGHRPCGEPSPPPKPCPGPAESLDRTFGF